jgi:hypothetical protein
MMQYRKKQVHLVLDSLPAHKQSHRARLRYLRTSLSSQHGDAKRENWIATDCRAPLAMTFLRFSE